MKLATRQADAKDAMMEVMEEESQGCFYVPWEILPEKAAVSCIMYAVCM